MESWGKVKSLPSVGGRKKNWGRWRGKKNNLFIFPSPPRPRPPTPPDILSFSPNSPSLQRIQNGGKTLERPLKPLALQATIMLKFNTFGLVKRDLVHASFLELSFTKNNRVYVRGHKYVLGPTHTLFILNRLGEGENEL